MIAIEDRIKIEEIIKNCYDQTFDILKKTENTQYESHVFRTLIVDEPDPRGTKYFSAFMHHYQGVFEGMFTVYFDEEFNRYPSPEEIPFIQQETEKYWNKLIDITAKYAKLELEKNKLKES